MDQYKPVDPGSVLGMVVAGPLGAMVGAGLAVAATQPNATLFPVLQRGRHTIANVELPRNGISAEHQEDDGDGAVLYGAMVFQVAYQCKLASTFRSLEGLEVNLRSYYILI